MGMPITIETVSNQTHDEIESIFRYFTSIDERYSTYKESSEISQINAGLPQREWSDEMKTVLKLCAETKRLTKGYFDIEHDGQLDPSGLVKGWAINNAAAMLREMGVKGFYIEAGGDIQVDGLNADGQSWQIGIRNPFATTEIVKVVGLTNTGIATSGAYIRGDHIYNPHKPEKKPSVVRSLTVIGSNVYEADRFATAAYAMDEAGIGLIDFMPGLEGYMIDRDSKATLTRGFNKYVVNGV